MPRKPKIYDPTAELRHRAEAHLRSRLKSKPPTAGNQKSAADTQRVLHELEVHQIELEMQNAELLHARTELELSLEKFTDLYDFAPMAYLTLDQKLVIREINLTGSLLLGTERSTLKNRRFAPFVSTADQPALGAFFLKVFATKERQTCEVTLKLENKMPLDVGMDAIAFESGRVCRLVLRDLMERRQLEANRLIANKLESTGILAGGIAHDFNNLLTVILLNIEMAQTLIPPDEKLAWLLEEAKQSGLLTRGLTAQLITFAEGGAPHRKPMALTGVIQKSAGLALSGSNVLCDFSLPEDLWPVEADADQIGQVMRNLILNAREAMPRGGRIFVRAENAVLNGEQSSLPAGEYVRVSVADQGTGVSKEALSKLFDPYFSTKQRGTQKGMGLGLTICHTVIQKHGGAISVESELGTGTTFQIYLPATSKALSALESAPQAGGIPRHYKILVVDDNEGLRKVLGLMLKKLGHEVEPAEDGRSSVEIYRKAKKRGEPFDVVILDLIARGQIGGMETIQELLRIDPAVKAIVMSGYANESVILEYGRHGFKGALAKPFDRQKLQELLSHVMKPNKIV